MAWHWGAAWPGTMPAQMREATVVPSREGQGGLDLSQAAEVGRGGLFPCWPFPPQGLCTHCSLFQQHLSPSAFCSKLSSNVTSSEKSAQTNSYQSRLPRDTLITHHIFQSSYHNSVM